MFGGRLFVHTAQILMPRHAGDPAHSGMSIDQPVERAATLEDVRAEVLTPDRLIPWYSECLRLPRCHCLGRSSGVLAFSVSARTREFGIRLAIGSQPRDLLTGVIVEGAVMAAGGVLAGAVFGYALARLAGSYFPDVRMPVPCRWSSPWSCC